MLVVASRRDRSLGMVSMSENKHRDRLFDVRREIVDVKSRLDEVLKEIRDRELLRSELEDDLAEWRRHEAWLARKVGDDPPSQSDQKHDKSSEYENYSDDDSTEEEDSYSGPYTQRLSHGDVIEQVLREAGRPQRVRDLIDLVLATGHALPKSHNVRFNTVYTAMKRHPQTFLGFPGGYWGLIGRDEKYQGRGVPTKEHPGQTHFINPDEL